MRQHLLRAIVISTLALPLAAAAQAQDAPAAGGQQQRPGGGGRGQYGGMQRVAGEVTAVSGATVTVKAEDGTVYTIVTTDNTRVMKGRGDTMKVAEIKPGDGVMAAGNLDAPNKALHAAMVGVTDAATVKKLKEDLGKTYIVGKVTAIDVDNAKMTVERTDKVLQTIGFDDSTSFKRGRAAMMAQGMGGGMGFGGGMGAGGGPRGGQGGANAPEAESITLADIKVGDTVAGQGALKAGTFVPTTLMVATPGQGGGRRRPEGAAATPPPGTSPQL